ncbi:5-formyltetrahydrofolate cyclo-ligase [Thiospirillum jenense]|uniref:5-formyltetrahydrofolate cyclo-ligase n=1 Tax=Thiospirillum jenense TaxID=1653858 RepID=A0A839HDV8_9GAMM|nr:5-formyltetrahydrofolate cyclo-ligase [Thiospirillum jenense]MBB1127115.1 5-formyltetrahydrofolate cyclo-ligase [Thiospirillum jenense]
MLLQSPPPDLKTLRRQLRTARRALSPATQRQHARAVASHLQRHYPLRTARRIAYYLARDGELDPQPLRERLGERRHLWYLPIIRPFQPPRLWFIRYRLGEPLQRGRFGLLQPRHCRHPVTPRFLDVILMPLVGFDATGQRLGMGGGYYDRSLAPLRTRQYWRRPHLLGLAHEVQRVARLTPQRWDVPLAMVVTERGLQLPAD